MAQVVSNIIPLTTILPSSITQALTATQYHSIESHVTRFTSIGVNTAVETVVPATMALLSECDLTNGQKKAAATALLTHIAKSENNTLNGDINWGDVIQVHWDLNKAIFSAKFENPGCCPWIKSCSCTNTPSGTSIDLETQHVAPVRQEMVCENVKEPQPISGTAAAAAVVQMIDTTNTATSTTATVAATTTTTNTVVMPLTRSVSGKR